MTEQSMSPPPIVRTSSSRMILVLGLVATLSGFLVVLVFQLTYSMIEENKRIAIEQAVFKVVPKGAVTRRTYVLNPKGNQQGIHSEGQIDGNGIRFYAAYGDQGQLLGVALEGAAQGYADTIKLIYGYDPGCQCVTGFKVIKMAETPGLGDKILTDQAFLKNFEALDVRLDEQGSALKHPIVTVKRGKKTSPWQIDAISGATISSRAVGKAIHLSASEVLPLLNRQLKSISAIKD